jgi:biopolymer transport protein ExbD
MAVRRLRKEHAHLEVTAFINLIVVLVPFLLSTTVFTRLAVLEMKLPALAAGGAAQLQVNKLQLEVTLRPNALDVGDRVGGLIQHLPNTDKGYDLVGLNTTLLAVKKRYPQELAATVLALPNTPYEQLIQVMDAMRVANTANGGTKVVKVDLFPQLSIGDAPLPAAAKGK